MFVVQGFCAHLPSSGAGTSLLMSYLYLTINFKITTKIVGVVTSCPSGDLVIAIVIPEQLFCS